MTDLIPGAIEAKIGAAALKALPWIVGAAALLAAGAYADRHAPFIGAQPTIDRLTTDRDAWRTNAGTYKAAYTAERGAFAQSEALRADETKQARAAVQAQAADANRRVAAAERSSAAIERIVSAPATKEPAYGPDDRACPSRALVPAGELRDVLRPAAAH